MQSLPIDVLHLIADQLPIRAVARLMSTSKHMYARKETVLCRALLRTRHVPIRTPVITADSKPSAKMAFVRQTAKALLPPVRVAILETLAWSRPTVTSAQLRPRTRAKVHVLCKRLGLKTQTDRSSYFDCKYRSWYVGGCPCCGDDWRSESWYRMTISL